MPAQNSVQNRFSSSRGFSLLELIVVIAIIAILATLVLPSIGGANESAQRQKAIAKAEALNIAIVRYKLAVPAASTNWSAASTDAAKYLLLTSYLSFAPATLADYDSADDPYGYTFGTLDQKVSITGGSPAIGTNY